MTRGNIYIYIYIPSDVTDIEPERLAVSRVRSIAGLLHVFGESDPSIGAVEQHIPVQIVSRQCQQLVPKADAGLQPAVVVAWIG